ncbi:hypothetical protein CR513_11218, partial [Mucuna pruriens]
MQKKNANKGRKEVFFKEGDLMKERFPHLRKSKLLPRGDGPFKILKRKNNNAYKVYMPHKFGGNTTFNVIDLSTQAPNLRSNSLQEGEDDAYIGGHTQGTQESKNKVANPTLEGPMTMGRLKRNQEEVQHELATFKGQEGQKKTKEEREEGAVDKKEEKEKA